MEEKVLNEVIDAATYKKWHHKLAKEKPMLDAEIKICSGINRTCWPKLLLFYRT